MLAAGNAATATEPSVWVVIGVISGCVGTAIALVALWRAFRDGPRLHVEFSLVGFYTGPPDEGHGLLATTPMVTISNYGSVPAYVDAVQFCPKPPWHNRWPLVRNAP